MTTIRCATHPEIETGLRCNRCETPICPRCLVQTPVGARCGACANLSRLPTFQVSTRNYAAASCAALGTALLLGILWSLLPVRGFFTFFVSGGIGYLLGEAVSLSTNKKRSRGLQIIAGLAVVESYVVSLVIPGILFYSRTSQGTGISDLSGLVLGAIIIIASNPMVWLLLALGILVAANRVR